MALQSSGPISWSTLNLAYGNASNTSLSISSIRNSTFGVGLSNVSMSNFQNACIPYPSYCMYRELSNSTTQFSDNAAGNTIFNNSNGIITYVNSTSVPDVYSMQNQPGLWTIRTLCAHMEIPIFMSLNSNQLEVKLSFNC